MEEKFVVGALVRAILGREKNETFIILKTDAKNHVLLVNGKQRKIENPKKKNIKHLICLVRETGLSKKIEENKIKDEDIIKTLKDYKSSKKI